MSRGGAGNILRGQQDKSRIHADLEAGHTTAESYIPSLRNAQPWAHMGRGGAGNFYSPRQLNENGQFNNTEVSQATSDGADASEVIRNSKQLSSEHVSATSSPTTRTYGRGGQGNINYDASENQEKARLRKVEEDRKKREKVKADVEADVAKSLAMPPRAKMPSNGPYGMG